MSQQTQREVLGLEPSSHAWWLPIWPGAPGCKRLHGTPSNAVFVVSSNWNTCFLHENCVVGRSIPRGFWKNISMSLMSEGAFVFMHRRGFWEEAGRVNRKDCRGTSSGKDVCPRYHHPCTFSLVSDTEQEERTQKSTGWKKWPKLPPVLNTLQAKAFLWIPSMISWIWDWSLNWNGLGIFKYQNGQATEGSAGDIFEEGKGNWNRECLKGMGGREMFFSCSLNWFHEGIVEIFTAGGYISQHNCWCNSFGSWKHPLCNHDKLWVSSLLCASGHLSRKWTGFTK